MAGSSTSRLQLYKPATVGEIVDVAQSNANMDKIDAAAGATVCTSTTRPSSPYAGQLIWETDTRVLRYWDATDGVWYNVSQTYGSIYVLAGNNIVLPNSTNVYIAYHDGNVFTDSASMAADVRTPSGGSASNVIMIKSAGLYRVNFQTAFGSVVTTGGISIGASVHRVSDNANIGGVAYTDRPAAGGNSSLIVDSKPFAISKATADAGCYVGFYMKQTSGATQTIPLVSAGGLGESIATLYKIR